MRVRATAICTHRAPLGMISPTRVPLLDAGLDERGRQIACRRVEFAVADPGHRVDHHRLGRALGGAEPDELVDGCGYSGIEHRRELLHVDLAAGQQRYRRR